MADQVKLHGLKLGKICTTSRQQMVFWSTSALKKKREKKKRKRETKLLSYQSTENLTSFPCCTPTGACMLPKKCPQDRSCDCQDDSESYKHGRRAFSMFHQHQI